jgi:multidrug efflux pump subunit AcrB
MKKIVEWFVTNPVASNLLMMVLLLGGILSLSNLREEEFPAFDVGLIVVSVPYLGAAPEDADEEKETVIPSYAQESEEQGQETNR